MRPKHLWRPSGGKRKHRHVEKPLGLSLRNLNFPTYSIKKNKKNKRQQCVCRCLPLPFKERVANPIHSMRTLQSLESHLIHPLNKKLPLFGEDAKLFLMNLRMNNGCLRRDEQTSGVLLIIGQKKMMAKHEGGFICLSIARCETWCPDKRPGSVRPSAGNTLCLLSSCPAAAAAAVDGLE